MLNYLCLVEKAVHNLGISLSANQNEKLVKGVWNVVVKFWSDYSEDWQYSNLNTQI